MIAADLSKHQALDADPKTMQQKNTVDLDWKGQMAMFFIIGKPKNNILDFS